MKRIDLSMLIGVIAAVVIGSVTGFGAECEEIRENVVRLHIVANSDSVEDQAVKYAVRDALLDCGNMLFAETEEKNTAEAELSKRLREIEDTAKISVVSAGFDYPVKAELVNMYFTTRQYGSITVPAGRYDALRVTLGKGEGQNWWCVMFPPMCVPAAMEKNAAPIEKQISELGANPRYKAKFAVVELIESVREAISGKKSKS